MKLSQKKNCEGCKAYVDRQGFQPSACELGFNNRGPPVKVAGCIMNKIVPQEPCYKPLTIARLFEAKHLIQIEREAA